MWINSNNFLCLAQKYVSKRNEGMRFKLLWKVQLHQTFYVGGTEKVHKISALCVINHDGKEREIE